MILKKRGCDFAREKLGSLPSAFPHCFASCPDQLVGVPVWALVLRESSDKMSPPCQMPLNSHVLDLGTLILQELAQPL